MRSLIIKIMITVFLVLPIGGYFLSLNVAAFITDHIKGRHGAVYSHWDALFYVQIAFNFFYSLLCLSVSVMIFMSEEKIERIKNSIKIFFKNL